MIVNCVEWKLIAALSNLVDKKEKEKMAEFWQLIKTFLFNLIVHDTTNG